MSTAVSRRLPRAARARRGMAMPIVLAAMVALALLSAGAFTAARETFRGGRNALVEQRAMTVAEFGLNQRIAAWDPRFNLPPAMGGVAVGGVDSSSLYVAANDTARVRITRLSAMVYSVESVGRASIPRPQLQAVRTVSSLVRLAYPEIKPRGAITAAGDIDVNGSATVDGRDTIPATWTQAQCADLRGTTLPALVAPPGAHVTYKNNSILSTPAVMYDPAAADSNTYVRYGTESWNTLAANATYTIAGGTYQPQPVDSAGTCRYGPNNWGEPQRGLLAVKSCAGFFPIIYAKGSITLNGQGRGQGILLVDGDLRFNGGFDWVGLIIVRDDIDKGTGAAHVAGGILARNAVVADGGSLLNGNQELQYSRCGVESALRGSAALVRVRDRGWTQLF